MFAVFGVLFLRILDCCCTSSCIYMYCIEHNLAIPIIISNTKMKWGILGCAEIARKNIRAIKLAESSELIAIASRDLEKAKKFAVENCLSLESVQLYGSYDELLADSTVDAVYIPLPTNLHLEWVTKAATARKVQL